MQKRTLAIAVTLVLVLSMGLSVVAAGMGHAAPVKTVTSAKTTPAATATASAKTALTNAPAPRATPASPHKGTIDVYDVYPGGATTEDPAVAYDTVSYEPMLNVFETLVAYNGSASIGAPVGGYVPVLATCVPGTAQCTQDYGNNLIKSVAGVPTFYTFVIDPQAQFYDQATGAHWGVYPSDVVYSISRDMAYSTVIGFGSTAGWLVAQALLPNGSATFDGALHYPVNTTPGSILGSMLVNDSAYCPTAAMSQAHGCVTFIVNGSGGPWPQFLQLIGDGFMGILPCGWYTAQGAGLPGWSGTLAANGDGSCLLPDGGNTTNNTAWSTYLAAQVAAPTGWDTYETGLTGADYPVPAGAGNVQWNTVGSGPYAGTFTPAGSPPGYSLAANPYYAQPVGCSGAGGLKTYGGYCWPVAGSYQPHVFVYYESSDTPGINAYKAGTADFASILTTDTGEMLSLAASGKINWFSAPTLSTFFLPFNLNWSSSAYTGNAVYGTVPNIPADFFSNMAVRGLLTHAYPYATAETTAWTIDGVKYLYPAGGPIAEGMQYYPSNVSYPAGNPSGNAPGSAAWWWTQGTTIGSGYYSPELAQCLNVTCTFAVTGEQGSPGLDTAIAEFDSSISTITSGHLAPFTFDLPFGGPGSLIQYGLTEGPSGGPLNIWNLGWAADNFDPQDYLFPMAFPDSTYTWTDTVAEQFALPQFDNVGLCGHDAATLANLIYWAQQPQLSSACQGVAYGVVNGFFWTSTHEVNSTLRGTEYWAIQSILNALSLYIWYGQSNLVQTFAPWIQSSSINTNPTAGGGGDQYYFQIAYVPYESQVKFTAKGLPALSTYTVVAGSPAVQYSSNGTANASLFAPNGTLSYSFLPPAGYEVSRVTGAKGATTQGVMVVGKPLKLNVFFVPIETLYFNETGLAPGTVWSVTITEATLLHTGPPNGNASLGSFSGTTSGTSIEFNVSKGGWKFVVSLPNNASIYKIIPPKGGVGVAKTFTKVIKFKLITANVVFKRSGLTTGTTWYVNLTGPGGPYAYVVTAGSVTVKLQAGSYSYTIQSAGKPGTSGIITVTPPTGQSVAWTF